MAWQDKNDVSRFSNEHFIQINSTVHPKWMPVEGLLSENRAIYNPASFLTQNSFSLTSSPNPYSEGVRTWVCMDCGCLMHSGECSHPLHVDAELVLSLCSDCLTDENGKSGSEREKNKLRLLGIECRPLFPIMDKIMSKVQIRKLAERTSHPSNTLEDEQQRSMVKVKKRHVSTEGRDMDENESNYKGFKEKEDKFLQYVDPVTANSSDVQKRALSELEMPHPNKQPRIGKHPEKHLHGNNTFNGDLSIHESHFSRDKELRQEGQVTDPYECTICLKTFKRKDNFQNHIKGGHGPPRFKCSDCTSVYRYHHDLKKHIQMKHVDVWKRIQEGENSESPNVKFLQFEMEDTTMLYRNSQENTDSFLNENESFHRASPDDNNKLSFSNLVFNIERNDEPNPSDPVSLSLTQLPSQLCPIVPSVSGPFYPDNLSTHSSQFEGNSMDSGCFSLRETPSPLLLSPARAPSPCSSSSATSSDNSGSDTTYAKNPDTHGLAHESVLPLPDGEESIPKEVHKCVFCPKVYRQRTSLKAHIEVVHYKKGYTCEWCQKIFPRTDQLKEHQQEVHDRITFTCHVCGKSFKRNRHRRTHYQKEHQMTAKQVQAMVDGNSQPEDKVM